MLVAWTTFAFAGVYPGTLVLPAVGCVVLAVLFRPWIAFDDMAILDRWLYLAVGLAAVQLFPLPQFLVDRLSPRDRAAWRALSLSTPAAALPLSIDLAAGAWAVSVGAGLVIVFAAARRIFGVTGVRRVTRAVSAVGLLLAGIGLAQDATAHGLMYWRWQPLEQGAPPFGPFVNRNHFATWAIMAVPLVLGYIAAHAAAHGRAGAAISWRRRLAVALDGRTIWLTASAVIMVVALAASLSRSGMFGLAVALLLGALLQRNHESAPAHAARWVAAGLAVAVIAVIAWVDPAVLFGRIAAAPVSAASRLVIWRDTIPMIRAFWLTGTGAGTYETAMLIYQRASPGVRFNQAHNQYLQFAAEGGLLLCVPAAIALWHFARAVARRLAADQSGMYWIRAGAACGLAGAAAQSLWETGLATPANALLAAIVAAIALHVPVRSGRLD
jgi:hypothetical protein